MPSAFSQLFINCIFTFSAMGRGVASTYDTKIESVLSHHTKCTMREEIPLKKSKTKNKKNKPKKTQTNKQTKSNNTDQTIKLFGSLTPALLQIHGSCLGMQCYVHLTRCHYSIFEKSNRDRGLGMKKKIIIHDFFPARHCNDILVPVAVYIFVRYALTYGQLINFNMIKFSFFSLSLF